MQPSHAVGACSFVRRIDALLERVSSSKQATAVTVAVVGGGAGGVEVAFAVNHRLCSLQSAQCPASVEDSKSSASDGQGHSTASQVPARVVLLSRGQILPSHPARARRLCLQAAADQGLQIHEQSEVVRVSAGALHLSNGQQVDFDECLWCTQAAPAAWLKECDLPRGALWQLLLHRCSVQWLCQYRLHGDSCHAGSSRGTVIMHCMQLTVLVEGTFKLVCDVQSEASWLSTTVCRAMVGRPRSLHAVMWPPVSRTHGPKLACLRYVKDHRWQRTCGTLCMTDL